MGGFGGGRGRNDVNAVLAYEILKKIKKKEKLFTRNSINMFINVIF